MLSDVVDRRAELAGGDGFDDSGELVGRVDHDCGGGRRGRGDWFRYWLG
jgi:hypothetical protein